jgi:hypothetical protein
VLAVSDISGAKARAIYVRRPETGYSSFNYDDVTKNTFKTSRNVNPLAPTYVIRDENGQPAPYGEIPGSSPTKLPQRKDENYFGNLNVRDIPGTAANSKRLGAFHSTARRDFFNPTDASDI